MWVDFAIYLAACFVAGSTGGLFPPGDWYENLQKPRWTPPNWMFPVAWMTLYVLMAYAGARLSQIDGAGTALALWSLQIALNALWTPVFFGLKKTKLALYCIFGTLDGSRSLCHCVLAIFLDRRACVCALSVVGQCRGNVEPRCVSPEP
jgi:tryptophan-rich sensory protein